MVPVAAPRSDTAFASARRADPARVAAQRDELIAEANVLTLLDAMPGPAMVLNVHRQIVLMNRALAAMLGTASPGEALGLRPGEAVKCIHHDARAGGCGTTPACGQCGAVRSVLDCFASGRRASHECRLTVRGEAGKTSLDLRVHATPLKVGSERFAVVALEDISAEKRREVLEQVFLHDLANTALGIEHVASLLAHDGDDPDVVAGRREMLCSLASSLNDQIVSQRDLLAAERGQLGSARRDVEVRAVVESTVAALGQSPLAAGRRLVLESGRAVRTSTDAALLTRVLENLIRNALEATPPGGTVSIYCGRQYGGVTVSVHNEGVMPDEVQQQVFQRSFTTKPGRGRGLGTYGARLLTERYLGGAVGFMSNEHTGTVFVVTLP